MPPNSLSARVAENVRAEMARRRQSQAALARHLGRTQQFVSRRMTGATSFTLDELDQIADILDVRLVDLLGDDMEAAAS